MRVLCSWEGYACLFWRVIVSCPRGARMHVSVHLRLYSVRTGACEYINKLKFAHTQVRPPPHAHSGFCAQKIEYYDSLGATGQSYMKYVCGGRISLHDDGLHLVPWHTVMASHQEIPTVALRWVISH